MDRSEMTVRNMLAAIEAPLYDIGALRDRGMLPGLDGITAAAVLERLPLLKHRNARGSHIYIRPSGEHRFTVLDDLNETTLARLAKDGYHPCAVVETSAGNFQAWLKHPAILPKLLATFAAQTLAGRYDADPSAADWRRFGRLPGFTNCKPKYRRPEGLFPFVQLRSHSGEQYTVAEVFIEEVTKLYRQREQQREERRISEALGLRLGDTDLDNGILVIRKSKFNKDRLIPLSDSLLAVLRGYSATHHKISKDDKEPFFSHRDGRAVSKDNIYRWFRKVIWAAGIPHGGRSNGPRVHDFRHTFSVYSLKAMTDKGMDMYCALPLLSTYLGHASVSATGQYVRLTQDMFPEIIEKVNAIAAFVIPGEVR